MTVGKCRRADSFTLVELLVTIVIIMILAGLILPALKGARDRSRDVLCRNNLKQLQVAAMTYAINANGYLPAAKSWEGYDSTRTPNKWVQERTGWIDWVNYTAHNDNSTTRRPGETPWWGPMGLTCITNGTLWPYVKSTKAYSCQRWATEGVCGKNAGDGGLLTFSTTNNKPWRCYAMNQSVSGGNLGTLEASKCLLFAESGNTNFYGATRISTRNISEKLTYTFTQSSGVEADGWDGAFSCQKDGNNNYPYENIGLYHNGKGNAVFVDGHVEQLTWDVTTNAAAGRW